MVIVSRPVLALGRSGAGRVAWQRIKPRSLIALIHPGAGAERHEGIRHEGTEWTGRNDE